MKEIHEDDTVVKTQAPVELTQWQRFKKDAKEMFFGAIIIGVIYFFFGNMVTGVWQRVEHEFKGTYRTQPAEGHTPMAPETVWYYLRTADDVNAELRMRVMIQDGDSIMTMNDFSEFKFMYMYYGVDEDSQNSMQKRAREIRRAIARNRLYIK